jgi:hypothetical protein
VASTRTIAAYHAHLASSNIQRCGACGAQLDIALLNAALLGSGFPFATTEAGVLVRRIADAPIQEEDATLRAHVLTEDLTHWAASKGAEVLP